MSGRDVVPNEAGKRAREGDGAPLRRPGVIPGMTRGFFTAISARE
ncbi:Uncharacterised protein [Raoultella ornithinolytica]|nr:Uncharacterised protein [Raoultella ornithinolytica]